MASTPESNRELILFGRYPAPGKTKTRLIPHLGPLGAADLQRRLTERALATIAQLAWPMTVTFAYSEGTRQQLQRWLGNYAVHLQPQVGENLGDRIRHAICDALDRGSTQVVLMGTDIPDVRADDLKQAFGQLSKHDLVIGPSKDGGYWLIGMKQPFDLFGPIEWGSPRVLSQTLAAVRELGLSIAHLAERNDIDTWDDLQAWQPDSAVRNPYLSVIIPALNEADHIKKTIAAARTPNCEILVADGGSADDTATSARDAGAKVISAARGRARQQNRAAQIARGQVLLFVHADTLLPQDFDMQVFDALLDPMVIAGAFRFKTDYHHPGMRFIERVAHLRSTLFQMPYGDQALFMPKAVFDQIGGFPEVAIAEDLLLVRRLGKRGKIHIAHGEAVTSGRRWKSLGLFKATIINYIIAIGCLLGVDASRMAPLYQIGMKKD